MDAFKTSSKRAEYFDFNKARNAKGKDSVPSVGTKVKDEDKGKDVAKVTDTDTDKDKEKNKEDEDDLELGDTAESIKNKNDDEEETKFKEPPSCFPNFLRKRWFSFFFLLINFADVGWHGLILISA